MATIPPFDATQAVLTVPTHGPAMDAMLITLLPRPPTSSRGRACFVHRNVPV